MRGRPIGWMVRHVVRARGEVLVLVAVAVKVEVDDEGVEQSATRESERQPCDTFGHDLVNRPTLPFEVEEANRRPEGGHFTSRLQLYFAPVVGVAPLAKARVV